MNKYFKPGCYFNNNNSFIIKHRSDEDESYEDPLTIQE